MRNFILMGMLLLGPGRALGQPSALPDGPPIFPDFGGSRRGDLCAVTREPGILHLNCFDGARFQAVRPAFPRSIESFRGGWNQIALQDRSGELWFATGNGLVQFPRAPAPVQLAAATPKAIYKNAARGFSGVQGSRA